MEPRTFGPFSLDPSVPRLTRDGRVLSLRPRALQVLWVLASHAGQTVGFRQMIDEAWAGTLVSKHTVAVTVGEAKRVLGEYGSWIVYRPNLGYSFNVPRLDEAIRRAWHLSSRQTREGIEKARTCFEETARQDPGDVRAWEGLAWSCLMLGTYGMVPSRGVYQSFWEAHRRAVELAGLTPELRAHRAHGLLVFERRVAPAEEDLLQVIRDLPNHVDTSIRLAMLYAISGRLPLAVETLERVRKMDPLAPTLPGAEVFVHLCRRDFDTAVRIGHQAMELHPYVPLARALYGDALALAGRYAEAIEQYRTAWATSSDVPWLRALEATALANDGQRGAALETLRQLEDLRRLTYVDAYFLAPLHAALGDTERGMEELERAVEEDSATLFLLNADPRMDPLRGHPGFGRLRDRVFHSSATTVTA
jgi:DNA-binding winged helix-turn-helix (wHTH) protein